MVKVLEGVFKANGTGTPLTSLHRAAGRISLVRGPRRVPLTQGNSFCLLLDYYTAIFAKELKETTFDPRDAVWWCQPLPGRAQEQWHGADGFCQHNLMVPVLAALQKRGSGFIKKNSPMVNDEIVPVLSMCTTSHKQVGGFLNFQILSSC